MNTDEFNSIVCSILRKNYSKLRYGEKLLAARVGVSPRTVRNWFDGLHGPQGAQLVTLMRECEELRLEIFKMIGERECQKALQMISVGGD